ncbi:DedA family protein [Dactylosporangium aurantiacum]|uniref:DedA family protein n=1 Tax=Dactylosporangium aurantiacum TaxID=35754 RepID=A0A9Q9M978_9ACTN|nr:DedA family protein [Dactylosporangium aurantiacum]MDG6106517.1 DedA family protein [Dactylosporangium aurantiacum]UWZ50453.1 DedA family protein [Dactylosporangium aurantiacum]
METLERYGYPALALLVLLEGIGVPTPAVSVVVAAAVLAGHGQMSLPLVVAITFGAAVAGDNLGFWLGRRAGRPVILRWGRRVGLTEPRLARAERFFARRGRNIVVVARFIDGLRQTNGLIAGAIALPWRQYTIRDAIGGAAWTALWVSVGAVAGGNLERLRALLHRYETPALIVAAGLLVSVSLVYVWRRRRRVKAE